MHVCKIVCHDLFVFKHCNFLPFFLSVFAHQRLCLFASLCICFLSSFPLSPLRCMTADPSPLAPRTPAHFPPLIRSPPLIPTLFFFCYRFSAILPDLPNSLSLLSTLPLPLSFLSLSVSLCCLLDHKAVFFFAMKAVSKSANQSQAKIAINQRYN